MMDCFTFLLIAQLITFLVAAPEIEMDHGVLCKGEPSLDILDLPQHVDCSGGADSLGRLGRVDIR